jgi:predicted hydrocarbon binding protein
MDTLTKYNFHWNDLGDIEAGRPNLGPQTHVVVYRLMQYTMRDILEKHWGAEKTNQFFIEAGFKAGFEFCQNMLDCTLDFDGFVADLTNKLEQFNIGILRVEKADLETLSLVLTVSEDLDCSGLPYSGVAFCDYDEGFIAGILNRYTGKNFHVKEVDCWGTGDRVCRFTVDIATA